MPAKKLPLAPTGILTGAQIAQIATARRQKDRVRLNWYDRYDRYYYPDEINADGGVQAMDPTGRPVLRLVRQEAQEFERRYLANILSPIVEDQQALIGQMPMAKMLPPGDDDAAKVVATKGTHYLTSTYDFCGFVQHWAEAAFHTKLYGDSCLVPEVVADDKRFQGRVAITEVDPHYAFPRFHTGWRRWQLYDLVVAWLMDPADVKDDYGIKVEDEDLEPGTELVQVATYISTKQRTTVVGVSGKQRWEEGLPQHHIEWDLPFHPAVWIFNKQAGGRHGQSDIGQALGLQDMYDFSLNVATDAEIEATYSITHVVDPQKFGEEPFDVGPGETVSSRGGGEIRKISPSPHPRTALDLAERARTDATRVAGTTQARTDGVLPGSIQTGRAIKASQGPQASRLDLTLALMKRGLEKMNQGVLMLQELAPIAGTMTFDIWGRAQGHTFREMFDPQVDIAGWYVTEVTFDRLLGHTHQEKVVQAMQGVAGRLHTRRYGMELIGVEDPEQMEKDVNEEALADARLEAEKQRMLQEAQQGSASPGAPVGPQAKPGIPNVQIPAMAGGPGAQQAGPVPLVRPSVLARQNPVSSGLPQGVGLQEVRQKLAGEKLKGQVFAVGELAIMGQSKNPQLRVTAFEDYRVVRAAIPEAEVRFMAEDKLPAMHELVA